jgi:hypothetical protein
MQRDANDPYWVMLIRLCISEGVSPDEIEDALLRLARSRTPSDLMPEWWWRLRDHEEARSTGESGEVR